MATTELAECPICSHTLSRGHELDVHVDNHFNDHRRVRITTRRPFQPTPPPPPPAQRPKSPAPLPYWECDRCTFHNDLSALTCSVCEDAAATGHHVASRPHRQSSSASSASSSSQTVLTSAAGMMASAKRTSVVENKMVMSPKEQTIKQQEQVGNGEEDREEHTQQQQQQQQGFGQSTSRTRQRTWSETEKDNQVKIWDGILKRQKMNEDDSPLVERIEALLLRNPKTVYRLCDPGFAPSPQSFDRKWGCGYRNLQCLISSLWNHDRSRELLGKVFEIKETPGIGELQTVLEHAWGEGFDPAGAVQLEHEVKGTQKWIGATEIVAITRSLGFQTELTDFREPTTPEGTHPLLFETIVNYFDSPSPFGPHHPPVFLQYQGHSLTIIGYEKLDDRLNLLIYDPGCHNQRYKASLDKGELRLFRNSLAALKKPQYQIVQVVGIYRNEKEKARGKLIDSKSMP